MKFEGGMIHHKNPSVSETFGSISEAQKLCLNFLHSFKNHPAPLKRVFKIFR